MCLIFKDAAHANSYREKIDYRRQQLANFFLPPVFYCLRKKSLDTQPTSPSLLF